MQHLDLFSGIGGFALAAEMVWDNVEHTFCDNDPFAQAILKKHWPNAQIYGDIRTLTNTTGERSGTRWPEREGQQWQASPVSDYFLLTGGFPCQPFSQAGRRLGTEDDRHLWPEMLRVIREFHPRWLIGENVGGLVTWSEGLVLEQVHTDLEGEGYEVQSFIIPAVSLNAPHRRDRVWIVGHASSEGRWEKSRSAHGNEGTNERRPKVQSNELGSSDKDALNAERERHEGQEHQARPSARHSGGAQQERWNDHWPEVAAHLCRVDDGVPRRLDRNPRLKALGNAIVPQVAAEIMRAIKEVENSLR